MATHLCSLAWKVPWAEEPGGLHSSRGCKELAAPEPARTQAKYSMTALASHPPLLLHFFILLLVSEWVNKAILLFKDERQILRQSI